MRYLLKSEINNSLKNNIEEKEIKLDIVEMEDRFIFKFLKEINTLIPEYLQKVYSKIDEVFMEIVFGKNENSILNINEIKEKWLQTKKDIVFNSDEDNVVQFVIDISKYFENEEALIFLIKNFSFIPFFTLLDFEELSKNDDIEKNLKIYNLFFDDEINYKIKFKYEEGIREKKISFTGKEDNSFDITFLRKKVREELNIPPGSPFSLNFFIEGEYLFIDNFYSLKVNFILDGGKYINKNYMIILTPYEERGEI